MKKFLLVIFSFFLFCGNLFAFEWGGLFKNESKMELMLDSENENKQSSTFSQNNGLFLWLSTPISQDENWIFKTEISYNFKYNSVSDTKIQNILDCGLLKVSGLIPLKTGLIDIAFGRFSVSDKTGSIFSTTSDGVSCNVHLPRFNLGVYTGYTGFTNLLTGNGFNGFVADSNVQLYILQAGSIPVICNFELPSLFANQSLSVQALLDFDCTKTKSIGNKIYGTLALEGPIISKLFYSFQTTFGTEAFGNVMNSTSLKVMCYPLQFFNFNVGVQYASGDELVFAPFKTVTANAINPIIDAQYTDGVFPTVALIFFSGPFYSKFEITGALNLFDGFDSADLFFKGVYGRLSASLNIYSDLQIGLDMNAFVNMNQADFSAAIKASFVF